MLEKVLVRRYPDKYTLIGQGVYVLPLEEAAKQLAKSGFMEQWIVDAIVRHLMDGGTFQHFRKIEDPGTWKGRDDGVVSEFRIATREEELTYVDNRSFEETTGRRMTRKSQTSTYTLKWGRVKGKEDKKLNEAYGDLPKQAKTVLDILAASEQSVFTEAAIEILLTQEAAKLKTKQPPMRIFGFYKKRLIDLGMIVHDEVETETEVEAAEE